MWKHCTEPQSVFWELENGTVSVGTVQTGTSRHGVTVPSTVCNTLIVSHVVYALRSEGVKLAYSVHCLAVHGARHFSSLIDALQPLGL